MSTSTSKVVLITGAARRIGAAIAEQLHSQGFRVLVHYNTSSDDALKLTKKLNTKRANSAKAIHANLRHHDEVIQLATSAINYWGRVDALINNASSFFPTPLGSATPDQWQDLFSSNLKAPFFLSQACAEELKKRHGHIINIADIHGSRPLKDHSIYCMAKAGNMMLTKTLAKELAPKVKVNGIAPGAILWPEDANGNDIKSLERLNNIPLKELGDTQSITASILFLLRDASYITGQIINVDGGQTLNQ